jgi:hypothetical protein
MAAGRENGKMTCNLTDANGKINTPGLFGKYAGVKGGRTK